MCVFKIRYSRRRMSTEVVPWNRLNCADCMRDWYWTIEPQRLKVDTLLRRMWEHLDIAQSFDDWRKHLLEAMGKEDDLYISLFSVHINEDKVPTDVLGFVIADIGESKGAYIKYLYSKVEKQGVGTVLLESVLKVVQQTSKHKLAFVNYKPTQELREFYQKRGFLPAAVRLKRNEEYDTTAEVRLTQTELNRLKEYCCSIHSELGVKMLTCCGKLLAPKEQVAQVEQEEVKRKRLRVADGHRQD